VRGRSQRQVSPAQGEVSPIAEKYDLSEDQVRKLITRFGNDREKIEAAARHLHLRMSSVIALDVARLDAITGRWFRDRYKVSLMAAVSNSVRLTASAFAVMSSPLTCQLTTIPLVRGSSSKMFKFEQRRNKSVDT
jgi:hypothetical protein